MCLFIGLQPSPEVCDALFSWVCQAIPLDGARIVPKGLYHVTLAFLGERGEHQLPVLTSIVHSIALACSAPSLSIQGCNFFGKGAGTILYAAIQPSELLTALHAGLCSALTEHDQPHDFKPLIPHITLARKGSWPPVPAEPLPALAFQPDRLILYHSTRVSDELQYLPLATAPFAR